MLNEMLDAPTAVAVVPDDAPHLLVIDDDSRIRLLLSRYLRDNGYRVTSASSSEDARRKMDGLAYDLVILDVMMPGEDGISFTHAIREQENTPILLLTAKSELEDRIIGLEAGADDYLPKPFEPRELLLRIGNILRRGGPSPIADVEFVRFGPFTYHLEKGELKMGTQPVRLTEREREMLRIFAAKPSETVARQDLLPDGNGSGERTVDVQINRLRRKIEMDPSNPLYLQTVRGIGYRLVVD